MYLDDRVVERRADAPRPSGMAAELAVRWLGAADLGGRPLQPGVKHRNALRVGEVQIRIANPNLRSGVGAHAPAIGDRASPAANMMERGFQWQVFMTVTP